MKAAVVTGAGVRPVHMEFDAPHAMPGHSLIDVTASALSRIAQGRAAGTHYSSDGRYPFVVGVDGVGRRLDDGQRVYFFGAPAPFGAMAERTIAPNTRCVPLPDTLDDVTAAAIAIPGMSSWAALTERARLVAGETVLVNGATGTSGRLAVRIAKHLGAAKVIATGRNAAALQALLNAGADAVVSLQQDDAHLARALEPHFRAGVDVVLDYLWGASAQTLLVAAAKATPEGRRLRFVQIGSIGGADVLLPGAVLRGDRDRTDGQRHRQRVAAALAGVGARCVRRGRTGGADDRHAHGAAVGGWRALERYEQPRSPGVHVAGRWVIGSRRGGVYCICGTARIPALGFARLFRSSARTRFGRGGVGLLSLWFRRQLIRLASLAIRFRRRTMLRRIHPSQVELSMAVVAC